MYELIKAIKQTNFGRASGKDDIPAETYKAAGPSAMEVFLDIIQRIWDQEKMLEVLRDALIVTMYKKKGRKADCGNYRGTYFPSVNSKKNLCSYHPEQTHCSFPSQPTRSPMWIPPWSQHSGHDITVKQVQEKCLEQNLDLYSVFIDLTKAFDTVNREALRDVLTRYGCSPKFIQFIRLFLLI